VPRGKRSQIARGARKLVAIRVRAGERFTEDNLGVKRPGDGIAPIEYWSYLGKIGAARLCGQ
jgi:sialic acid synthase SpsE